jgi:hypothetical protein
VEPSLINPFTEIVLPNCMKFKTLKVLPNLVAPNTENDDPKRMKLLILMLEEKEV